MIALALACDPAGHDRRRADDRARRRHAGAGPRAARELRARARPRADPDHATTSACWPRPATGSRSCTRGGSSRPARPSTVFAAPQHPYTKRLLGAFPLVGGRARAAAGRSRARRPTPRDPPAGCRFHPRCPSRARPASMARWRCGRSATATSRPACSRRCSRRRSREACDERRGRSPRPSRRSPRRATSRSRSAGAGAVVRALDGVDLEWRRNEVLGVVGESGCGKSTLARTLLGLEPPSGGELRFEGAALDRGGLRDAAAQGADGLPGSRTSRSTRACA